MGEANGRTMYIIYVLQSKRDKKLYIGCTSDLDKRLLAHNAGNVRSTKHRRPLQIVYQEEIGDRFLAFQIERYYKTAKGKRELLKKL